MVYYRLPSGRGAGQVRPAVLGRVDGDRADLWVFLAAEADDGAVAGHPDPTGGAPVLMFVRDAAAGSGPGCWMAEAPAPVAPAVVAAPAVVDTPPPPPPDPPAPIVIPETAGGNPAPSEVLRD